MAGIDDATKGPINPVIYRPTRPVGPGVTGRPQEKAQATPSFDDLLRRQLQSGSGVKFSAHAQKRLEQAQIPFGADRVARLEEAVNQAASKGARESLILMRDLALVVSIHNRTVITAVDGERMRDNVFTNIDSAVITEA